MERSPDVTSGLLGSEHIHGAVETAVVAVDDGGSVDLGVRPLPYVVRMLACALEFTDPVSIRAEFAIGSVKRRLGLLATPEEWCALGVERGFALSNFLDRHGFLQRAWG
jgi:hypothetical protein